ncbi:MAG: hypothetical protein EOP07_03660 [Proteobacteria bacterium]|nr:MAG: hypothetical protein EOP07_03660 [Pseudomonadota bacterium]
MKASKKSRSLVETSLLLALSLVPAACGKSSDSAPMVPTVENDKEKLSERMNTEQSDVPFTPAAEGQSLGLALGDSLTAIQVAQITPPTVGAVAGVGGNKVQATDVAVNGLSVYVGYNTAGDTYNGAIDVIDATNVLSLQILSQLNLPGEDINGLDKFGGNLYAVGSSNVTEKGFIRKIALNSNLLTTTTTDLPLTGFTGTGVVASASKIYATSGDNAGLTTFDTATFTQSNTAAVHDARAVKLTAAGLPMVLGGQPGTISTMTAAGALTSSFALSGNATPLSKSSLSVGPVWSVASLGEGGFTVFCNASGAVIAHVPAITLPGIDPSRTVTNSVTSVGGLIYTTNGEAGVNVYTLRDVASLATCGAGTVSLVGNLDLGAGFSPNGIYSNGLVLYVASGLGGLKVITTVFTTLSPLSSKL